MSISGKHMSAFVNGAEVPGSYSWNAEEVGDVLDATVGSDGGWEREDMGVQGLHVTVKAYLDISTGSYTAYRRGTILTDVDLYRHIEDATPAFSVSEALVVRSRQGGEVRGKLEIEFEFHSRGDVVTVNDPS